MTIAGQPMETFVYGAQGSRRKLGKVIRTMSAIRITLMLPFLSMLPPSTAASQAVAVTPTALFLDRANRSGRMVLANDGDSAAEVEISFAFGYARSDSTGVITVPLTQAPPEGEPDLTPYLRAFPRRLRLAPGQRNTVRILVQAPNDLPDGEYWGRVLVSSTGAEEPVEERVGRTQIKFNIRTTMAVAANYRHGSVRTSVAVEEARASATDSVVNLLLDLSRGGNAAWLGQISARVVDRSGKELGNTTQDAVVYRPLRWKLQIPLKQPLEPGPVSVEYLLSAVRPDEDPEDIIGAPPVQGTVPVG